VAKDRARPFSRKHRKYWLTITGGMLVIAAIDLILGFSFWPHRGDEDGPPQPIHYAVRQYNAGPIAHLIDAGVPEGSAAPTATPR
jgi:hypothetical protein